ncbi:MAG TPA: ParB/RepB/Spo0J family partition protein [Blastocatellia bacterium]|nr:ParB/RepB/Spo0J family partition protein [Blastocatellia bacterium]HMX24106.1 ParB/RepB/Spo0J family partition protein [Blastocatellia bacterium]HMY70726.1 ParB/RepB/Spo0J family partition protein [Blastocatellia bacterium]HMZ16693.1 ParB/RepB/Spo0J family partition protein [Blastocatellia bacterium]HNG28088.1 ParB/RepB/Spo0J family partition protein [Blastocatellia bacterium]
MTRKALGRGLSALLADSLSQGDELLEVDIDLIEPNPDQPRVHFKEEKLNELAQSIRANGLVQPILLRRVASGRYQIVAGERRWRAAQRAGLHKINAVIRSIPDAKLLELALIENIQRQELNPIEEALAYQRLIQTLGLTQDEVAQRVGKDRSSVANYLRLLKLPGQIQQMLEEDLISMGHARALLGLESEEEQLKLAEEIVARKLSVRETEQAVKKTASVASNRENSTPNQNDANIRAAELKLKRHLGTQVRIHLNQNGGKIEVEFSSISELDRIYSVIMRKSDS